MTETQAHGREILGVKAVQKRCKLRADPMEEFGHVWRDDLDPELLLDRLAW